MTELAFSTHGNPASPPVALLHGFMSCAAQWWPNLDALSERYFLVNIELWGHGESPEPDAIEDYSVDGYVRALDAIRAHRLGTGGDGAGRDGPRCGPV